MRTLDFDKIIFSRQLLNTTLTSINLADNNLGQSLRYNSHKNSRTLVGEAIQETLEQNTTLTSINLAHNQFYGGIQFLCKGLKTNTTLQTINLSKTIFGDDDEFINIIDTLIENRALKSIDLTGCISSDVSHELVDQHIARLINENTSLTSICLANNCINDVRAIGDALLTNTRLTAIDLSDNNLGRYSKDAIAAVIKKNTMLTSINLSQTYIFYTNPDGVFFNKGEAIKDAVMARPSTSLLHIETGNDQANKKMKMLMYNKRQMLELDLCLDSIDIPKDVKDVMYQTQFKVFEL